jgi:Secretion system C-terminal sorting domain/GEVED domain
MKKITLLLLMLLTTLKGFSQFGCGTGVIITNGYTSGPITTPGLAGPEDWVTLATPLTGTNAAYWNDDVYLFQYTAGTTTESISITVASVNSWNGVGIFSTCTGTTLSGALATQGTTGANTVKTLTATLAPSQTVYIAVGQWGTPNDLKFSVTNFTVTPVTTPPACTVLAVPVSGATSVSSTLISWAAATGSPSGYKVFAGTTPGGTNIVNGVITSSLNYSLPAFALSTTYYVKIVPTNSNGNAAGCTESSFTSCGPLGNTWTENFDGVTIPALPSCWTGVFAGAAPGAQVITGDVFASTPNSLRIRSDASLPTASIIAVSPNTPNLNGGTNRLVFKAINNDATDDLIIGTLSNPSDASTFTPLQNVDINTTFAQYIVSFVSYTGTDKYIGIKRLSNTQFTSVYIDDISWELAPAAAPVCAVVTATPNATCGNFNTVLSWPAVSGANGYKLTIGTTAGGSQILNNVDIASVLNYSYAGSLSTTYFYKLVPYNNIGNAVGCSESSFTTNSNGCYCPSIPTSNDGAGISNVTIGTIAFPTTDVTYFDHTATTVNMSRGISNNVQITFQTGYTYDANIWVDLNDNFTFEPSELLKNVVSSNATLGYVMDASFVIPATAALGIHRMRIGTSDVSQLPGNPCYNGTYGVYLDFKINVITATCTPPAATTAVVENCASNQYSVNINVTALGSGSPSISYGATTTPITAIGIVNIGPFVAGTPTSITLLHGSDTTCNVILSSVNSNCPATNDICTTATNLTVGGVFATNVINSTSSGATTTAGLVASCSTSTASDVWFSVTVPASGNITIETDAPSPVGLSTVTDTVMSVFSGVCGTLVSVGCDDDLGNGNFSKVVLTGQTPGSVLKVAVWQYSSGFGTPGSGAFRVSAYDASLSTNSFNNEGFSYYPNPVVDYLKLSYTQNIDKVEVMNMLGQVVLAKTINANESSLDMSSLAKGTYMVKVAADNQIKTIKVIKE